MTASATSTSAIPVPGEPIASASAQPPASPELGENDDDYDDRVDDPNSVDDEEDDEGEGSARSRPLMRSRRRRLSTYQSIDGGMNLEDDFIGGSAKG